MPGLKHSIEQAVEKLAQKPPNTRPQRRVVYFQHGNIKYRIYRYFSSQFRLEERLVTVTSIYRHNIIKWNVVGVIRLPYISKDEHYLENQILDLIGGRLVDKIIQA